MQDNTKMETLIRIEDLSFNATSSEGIGGSYISPENLKEIIFTALANIGVHYIQDLRYACLSPKGLALFHPAIVTDGSPSGQIRTINRPYLHALVEALKKHNYELKNQTLQQAMEAYKEDSGYDNDDIRSMTIAEFFFHTKGEGKPKYAKMLAPLRSAGIRFAGDLEKLELSDDGNKLLYPGSANQVTREEGIFKTSAKPIEYILDVMSKKGLKVGGSTANKIVRNSIENLAADDFTYAAINSSEEGVKYTVKFKDETLQTQWKNLVRDEYISIAEPGEDPEQSPQEIFERETGANIATFEPSDSDTDGVITLSYKAKNGGLETLASGSTDVLSGFAHAVNQIMPKAQKKALDRAQQQAAIKAQQIYGTPAL